MPFCVLKGYKILEPYWVIIVWMILLKTFGNVTKAEPPQVGQGESPVLQDGVRRPVVPAMLFPCVIPRRLQPSRDLQFASLTEIFARQRRADPSLSS